MKKPKRRRRRRLTQREWIAFKTAMAFNNIKAVTFVNLQAQRRGTDPAKEWDEVMRAWLTSFYFALPPKKEA